MKTEYDSYKGKIKDLEKALADYEDKWYKKFSKMETAMAKLQSNTSAVTSMLGM
jgi:flagellar hook-associated protein 2